MEEVFQNFEHYSEWILSNWNKDAVLDSVIIKSQLILGEPYRQLTKDEFDKREGEGLIKIPTIYESDDYKEGQAQAEEELNQFDKW